MDEGAIPRHVLRESGYIQKSFVMGGVFAQQVSGNRRTVECIPSRLKPDLSDHSSSLSAFLDSLRLSSVYDLSFVNNPKPLSHIPRRGCTTHHEREDDTLFGPGDHQQLGDF